MNKEPSYVESSDTPHYVLVHKRALVAMSHFMGLALKGYAISAGAGMEEISFQLNGYVSSHANELSQYQVDRIVALLIENQEQSGVLDLSSLIEKDKN